MTGVLCIDQQEHDRIFVIELFRVRSTYIRFDDSRGLLNLRSPSGVTNAAQFLLLRGKDPASDSGSCCTSRPPTQLTNINILQKETIPSEDGSAIQYGSGS